MAQPTYEYSGVCYTATSGQTAFALTSTDGNPIGYLSPAHIHVRTSTDSGETWSVLPANTGWTFADPATSIVLTTPATVGEWVDIQRKTPIDTDWIDFQAGSLLTAGQLNEAETFSLYCDQEIIDGVRNGTIAPEDPGVMEIIAGSNVVIDPTDGKGSVTISSVQVDPGVTEIVAGNNVNISPAEGTGSVTISSVQVDPGVTKIKAGENVEITPSGGTGEVTIKAIQPDPVDPGVTKIKAGRNVEISPSGGTGEVTINSVDIDTGVTKITAGPNITISPTNGTGNVTITGQAGGGGGMVYKGTTDVTGAAPSGPKAGDLWVNTTAGTASNSWTGLGGDAVAEGDRVVYNGSVWELIPSPPIAGYLPLTGGSLTGDLIVYGDAQLDEEGVKIQSGLITTCQEVGSNSVFRANTEAGGDYKIDLNAAGRASFAGDLYVGTTWAGLSPTTTPPITLSATGDATFKGDVTADKFIGDGSLLTNLPGGGGGGDVGTLQQVTDKGNTTTNGATFAGGLTQILSSGNQKWGGNGYDGTQGSYVSKGGTFYATPASGTEAFLAYNEGSSTPTVTITGAGAAKFAAGSFAIESDGDISTNIRGQGNVELDSTGAFTNPKVKLFAATGAATFKGDVAIGDSAVAKVFNLVSDVVAALSAKIREEYADVIATWNLATPYTDPTVLPGVIPTPLKDAIVRATTAGKINLNADGAATFAGKGTFGSYVSTPEYFVSNSAIDGLAGLYAYNATGEARTDSALIISNDNASSGTTINLKYDGAATFKGTVTAGGFNIDALPALA